MNRARIGIFAHSTNPRGGVVHAMQLAEALCDLGEDATLLAPAPENRGFFRPTRCPSIRIPAACVTGDLEPLVRTRRSEIAAFLRTPAAPRFDILHAQDPISALALSDLAREGCITGFIRTVHHLDDFTNPNLARWQDAAVRRAAQLLCVSRLWQVELGRRFGRLSCRVGNGVDTRHFTPDPDPRDIRLRERLLPRDGRIVLAIGGVEARKNTLGILRAFLQVLRQQPDLQLVIAGGATLLDHSETHRVFDLILRSSGKADHVRLAGVVEDADMPSLYRNAAMLCFPSLQEGFGLCVIEAMASGIPVIAPQGPPFDEYLDAHDAIRVDPASDASIAVGMLRALRPDIARLARSRGPGRAGQFSWQAVAARHVAQYDRVHDRVHHRIQPEITEHA